MIDKLRSMAIFATVVDQGTFRAAAQHLGLAPSRISQAVSDLEKELGVTLLYRSTRQQSLTTEGEILHSKVGEMLQAAENGLDAINLISNAPSGELRVTAPTFVTQTRIMDSIAEFAKLNPGVDLKINFSDHSRDLIKDGFDVGIRAGLMQDSELMSRSIGHSDRLLVASPHYVASKTKSDNPKDLEQWDWIHFSPRPDKVELMSEFGENIFVVCNFRIEVDSAYALYELAVRGLGITPLPETLANRGFRQGELIRVMPKWAIAPLEFHAVWPDRSRRESLSLLFIRFLAAGAVGTR